MEEEDLDEGFRRRLKDSSETPGALWHIYLNKDMDQMREFLHKVNTVDQSSVAVFCLILHLMFILLDFLFVS